jgi:RNA polymerase sigma factor (sigma-70 family)
MTPSTDIELMRQLQAGDLSAFDRLVERHQRVVYSMAVSILSNTEDAEEAVQDTFIKLFRARMTFDGQRDLLPWLLRIAGNSCRDRRRRRIARGLTRQRDLGEVDLGDLVSDTPQTYDKDRDAIRQAVAVELGKLSADAQRPLVMKYQEGMTNQQIADAMGISVSNLKIRLTRAREVLQSRLGRIMEA